MNKEEYLSAIRSIEQKTTEIEDYESIPRVTSCCVDSELKILEQLINEHFELVDKFKKIELYLYNEILKSSRSEEND